MISQEHFPVLLLCYDLLNLISKVSKSKKLFGKVEVGGAPLAPGTHRVPLYTEKLLGFSNI